MPRAMPHLRFRGVADGDVQAPLAAMLARLPETFGCPADWITAESVATTFLTPVAPMVEILWFARSPEVRDAAARIVTDAFADRGIAVTVVFVPLAKEDYYEDGRNFA